MELKKILIVDEQFPMLANIQRILRDCGYSVILAPDARSALAELPGHHFDLLLVSLNGYEEDKLNLLRWAGRSSAQPKLMVVGYAKVTLPMDVFRIKVDDYILPPFTAKELSTRVDRCLNSGAEVQNNTTTVDEHIGNVINYCKQEIGKVYNELLSFKSKFNLFVDQQINTFNDSSVDKINEIYCELNLLINMTESILHSMLTCRNEQNSNATGSIFPQDFFKQNKVTQLH